MARLLVNPPCRSGTNVLLPRGRSSPLPNVALIHPSLSLSPPPQRDGLALGRNPQDSETSGPGRLRSPPPPPTPKLHPHTLKWEDAVSRYPMTFEALWCCRWRTMLRNGLPALYLLCLTVAHFIPSPHRACILPERHSLLSFLSNISSPGGRPLLWQAAANDCCLWEGVTCDADGSVVGLQLPGRGLGGTISSSLEGLARLAELNLSHNSLEGVLPQSVLWSDHIVNLDVSFNRLHGQLPPPPPPPVENSGRSSASASRPIQSLNVSSNRFTGEFPRIPRLPRLQELNASNNSFSGPIPSSICALSPRLRILDFSHNQFADTIPPGLGNCSDLEVLDAGFNNLAGQLPVDLYDIAQLSHLALPDNQVTGGLRGDLISRLTNLVVLDLGGNDLMGELPGGIGRLTNLQQLLLSDNRFNGTIPSELLRNCTKLRNLNLRNNHLTGDISDVDFSPLSQLSTLDLGSNYFTAPRFPVSIHLCRSLTALRLAENSITGSLEPEILELRSLSHLSLSYNKLKGIRQALQRLGRFKNLTVLLLARNFDGEAMPDGLDADWVEAFPNLRVLGLGKCHLTGRIPPWIAGLRKLEVLDLSGNQLAGRIPTFWAGALPNLFFLDMSDNRLSGEIPLEMTGMKGLQSDTATVQVDQSSFELPLFRIRGDNSSRLRYNKVSMLPPSLDLSNNSLSGMIPPEIGQLKRLLTLNLSMNKFSGEIPVKLSDLSNLQILDLSSNRLFGPIPRALIRLNFLSAFSVAHNNLSGPVPTEGQFGNFPNSSFAGNDGLCGPVLLRPCSTTSGAGHLPRQRRRRSKRLLLAAMLITGFGVGLISILLVFCILSRKRGRDTGRRGCGFGVVDAEATSSGGLHGAPPRESRVVVLSPGILSKNLTVSEIIEVTNNFSQDNIVGCGGFGLVYKAKLDDGTELAIKKLAGDMGLMEREFAAEVEALSTARHENLVPLWGYCVHGSVRLLLYSYMQNGSLDFWLHEKDDGGSALDWPARLRIAQGVSQGLAYIHLVCDPPIIHRDIKSSNILLDQEFNAHLADFGLARLILPHKTHVSTELVGTLGYIPPEYGNAWVATMRGDIYSFGVVLLELLTGRRPIDALKPKQSSDLVGWVLEKRRQGEQEQVFDPQLSGKGFEEQMSVVLGMACLCVSHNPSRRPMIREVVSHLAGVGADPCTVKQ